MNLKMSKRNEKRKESEGLLDVPSEEELEFYNSRYFIINMTTLRLMGLWPYQSRVSKLVVRLFYCALIIISTAPQVIAAVIFKRDVPKLIQSIGTLLYFNAIMAKLVAIMVAEKRLKVLYKNIVRNWTMLESEAEKKILEKHSEIGRLLTIGYFTYMMGAMILFILLPIAPRFVNMIASTPIFNGSLTEMLILEGEYLVDKNEYYYYIYSYEACFCFLTVPLYSTIDSTYAVCVQQCVGLLDIVKMRLQLATKHTKDFKSTGEKFKDAAYHAIAKSSELHEKVLNFGRILESTYSTNFFVVLSCNTCILTTTSVCILFRLDDPVLMLRYIFLIIGFAMHVFYLSWPGQKLIDGSNAISHAAYDNEWYECSIESQKLLKFIMQRTLEPLHLTAGGFYIMNFENFEMLMKTSLSYITVLASFK